MSDEKIRRICQYYADRGDQRSLQILKESSQSVAHICEMYLSQEGGGKEFDLCVKIFAKEFSSYVKINVGSGREDLESFRTHTERLKKSADEIQQKLVDKVGFFSSQTKNLELIGWVIEFLGNTSRALMYLQDNVYPSNANIKTITQKFTVLREQRPNVARGTGVFDHLSRVVCPDKLSQYYDDYVEHINMYLGSQRDHKLFW
jgi:hypothetical protein